jgi:4-hydroxymandelate oxidase
VADRAAGQVGEHLAVLVVTAERPRSAGVVKAIALGADVVVIGRLAAYGLAAGGAAGVSRVLELLGAEITTIPTLLGRGSLADLNRDALVRVEAD